MVVNKRARPLTTRISKHNSSFEYKKSRSWYQLLLVGAKLVTSCLVQLLTVHELELSHP